MSDDESNDNQSIEKIFNEYKIKLSSNMDYINIQIQNNDTYNIYETKFNFEYLHQFRLLGGNFTIEQMTEFINNLIKEKDIKIEENKKDLKLTLISKITSYPSVELILKKENIFEKLMNEIKGIKNENKLLKINYEKIKNKIELIEKGNNEAKINKEEYKKLNNRIELIEKENEKLKNSIKLIINNDKLNKEKDEINKKIEIIEKKYNEFLDKIMKVKINNDEFLKEIIKEKENNEKFLNKIEKEKKKKKKIFEKNKKKKKK